MEKTIKTAYNKLGIRGIIRHIGQRVVNMEEIEERIKTTNYFLNHYCNIKDFPKAEGNLRLMQIGDSILLAIFDAVCKKHGFEYWIDSGTCLGAVRHKGFIPWDDDTDLCMMRDTYDNAKSVIKKELAIYGIDCDEFVPDVAFGVGYQHKDTGIWIDLLPAYYTTIDTTQSDERNLFLRRNDRYRYLWEKSKKRMNPEWTRKLRKKHFPEICTKENAKSIIYSPEFGARSRIWEIKDVFPLQRCLFEGYSLPMPNDTHNYLVQFYGEEYMNFPQLGIFKHGDKERGSLITWAEKSGIDMQQTVKNLKEILQHINET